MVRIGGSYKLFVQHDRILKSIGKLKVKNKCE